MNDYESVISDLDSGYSTKNVSPISNTYNSIIDDLTNGKNESLSSGPSAGGLKGDISPTKMAFDIAAPNASAVAHVVSSMGSHAFGGLHAIWQLGSDVFHGKSPSGEQLNDTVQNDANQFTYQPTPGTTAEENIKRFSSNYNPLNWPSLAADKAGELTRQGVQAVGGSPEASGLAGATVNTALNAAPLLLGDEALNAAKAGVKTDVSPGGTPPGLARQSVGASATVPVDLIISASDNPILRQVKEEIKAAGPRADPEASARQIEAASLPVPMQYTQGQATKDIHQISWEMNNRGKHTELGNIFNQQNGQLVENINAIRDNAAPDVYAVDHVENGQSLIDSYKSKDATLNEDISAKYKALEEANGGKFPVDGKSFVESADQALAKKLKGRYVPPEIQADMQDLRDGGQMTYENFENMRTNLASEARKAERAGDGNRSMAISLVRDSLESLPMSGESANIKPLADAARSAAKQRFDLINNDPAYKAAVNDSVAPDDFIKKFVINGKVGDVKTLKSNLAHDPLASQAISSGTINYLKDRAGITSKDTGNFSQSNYNKQLEIIRPKLNSLVSPETANQLDSLGNVARITQQQPRGSYVNNSNTLVGALKEGAASAAEGGANSAFGGVRVGTMAREFLGRRSEHKKVRESLKVGAGIRLSDITK